MAAEPIKLNLSQKKAIKEANEGDLKNYMETISKAMGQPITFEWTVEQTLGALQASAPATYEEYKDRVVKITYDSYVKSLSESFGRDDETLGNPVIIEELKKIWTTGKLTFTVLPGTTKPDFTKDVAVGSRDHNQNGIRIVDGTLDIWTNVDNYYCAADALYTFDWKVYNLFNNVPNDGFSVKAKMQMAMPKYVERMTQVEKELKELGAPADLKFDPVTDFKTIVAAKPNEDVTLDRLYQYYEYLRDSLKYWGMKDPDVKEAILDVWKGKVRVDIVDSLAAVPGTKEVNTYNGVKFDGDVLVILIEKERWACGIDVLGRCEWVKLF